MLMFCRKLYQFIVLPWTNGGHLGFYPECNVQKYFLTTPLYVMHPWKPFGRHPNHESLYSVEIISIHCLTLHKWGHFISAYLQVSVSILTFFLLPGDWRPFWKMQIMLRQVCKTTTKIVIWNQLIKTFNLSLSVGLYLAFDFFTVFTLWLAAILEISKLG